MLCVHCPNPFDLQTKVVEETAIEIDIVPIAPVNDRKSGKPGLQIPKNDENFIDEADGTFVSTDYASGSFECEVDLELLHLAQSKSYLSEIDTLSIDAESIHSQRIMDGYVDIATEPVKKSISGCDQDTTNGLSISVPKSKAPRGTIEDSLHDLKRSPIKFMTNDSDSSMPTPEPTQLPTVATIDGSFCEFMQELIKAKSDHNLPMTDLGMDETFALIQRSLSPNCSLSPIPKKEMTETVENPSPMLTSDEYEIEITSFGNHEMENESILSDRSETIISSVKASTTTNAQKSTESNSFLSPTDSFMEIQRKYGHEKNW